MRVAVVGKAEGMHVCVCVQALTRASLFPSLLLLPILEMLLCYVNSTESGSNAIFSRS